MIYEGAAEQKSRWQVPEPRKKTDPELSINHRRIFSLSPSNTGKQKLHVRSRQGYQIQHKAEDS